MKSAFQDKYDALANTTGVTEDEEAIAKFMFFAGIKFALKQAATSVARVESSIVHPILSRKTKKDEVKLTVSEAQSLKDHLAYVLTEVQEYENNLAQQAKLLYQSAEKDSMIGKYAFRMLNSYRNKQRKVAQDKRKLQGIQKKLKSISRQG